MNILSLTTVHNRKEKTLKALEGLSEQILPTYVNLDIALVDDGSSDGTWEAVEYWYPKVKKVKSEGNLYWAGGMRYGFRCFWNQGKYDYLLVFNDDIELQSDALHKLIETASKIKSKNNEENVVTGVFLDPETNRVSYGGLIQLPGVVPLKFQKLPISNTINYCDTLNMNFALISSKTIESIGFLSPQFTHAKADYDYGLRLKKNGGVIATSPGFAGYCSKNLDRGTSDDTDVTISTKWKRLSGIKEESFYCRYIFVRRHAGWLWPLVLVIPYINFVIETLSNKLFIKENK